MKRRMALPDARNQVDRMHLVGCELPLTRHSLSFSVRVATPAQR
jgi:hypothetical protein